MKRRIAALVIAAITMSIMAIAWVVPTAAGAATTPAPYPPPACGIFSVSTTTVKPGEAVTVSGTGFTPKATLKIVFAPPKKALATVTISAAGTFSTTVTIPDERSGRYSLSAVIAGMTCPIDPIQIVIASGSSGSSGGHTPASTGVDVELLAALAGLLLVSGLGMAGAGRRRGRSHGRHAV